MNPFYLKNLLIGFLNEDLGTAGDITTAPLPNREGRGEIIAKENFVLCGTPFVNELFALLDGKSRIKWNFKEGEYVNSGEIIGEVKASLKALLTAERTALNLLQRLSGIATETRRFVELLSDSGIKLLDTRKTTPGMRLFEKYATRIGGAFNHRLGLFDAVMIKDNHIKAYGGVKNAVLSVRNTIPVTTRIEVEVENWQQVEELIEVIEYVDIVMLDNWKYEEVEEAVKAIKEKGRRIKVEISGNVTYENLKLIKKLPVDYVSTSRIVTAARWIDISLEVV